MPAGSAETIVILRPPPLGRFGDPQVGVTVEIEVAGCLFAPGPSSEDLVAANQVDTDATVYAPVGTVVLPTDRIRARGKEYSVVGEAQEWAGEGVVIKLRRVTG